MSIAEFYELFLRHPHVSTDTRHLVKNSLFFALKGASFDGNQFALQALEAGCAYAVVDDYQIAQKDERCIYVDDALVALQVLAAYHRRQLGTPILQITGTNGKTTTKELVAAVLSERLRVLYTEGNLNNHIGVPLTLLRLTDEHEFAVIETGANHVGEIAMLSDIVQPNCGIITNVGKAHIEGFGSFEGVIQAKTELYENIRKRNMQLLEEVDGSVQFREGSTPLFVFLNGDNPHLAPRAEGLPTLTYGSPDHGYIVEGEVVSCDPFLTFRWRKNGGQWHEVSTQLIGAYNLDNALAAVLIGLTYNVHVASIDKALRNYSPNNNRSEYRKTERNRLIIDAYNANLSSMHAALQSFAQTEDAHKMMILGDMRELGTASADAHAEVLQLALTTGSQQVWLVGSEFAQALTTLPADKKVIFRTFPDVEAVKVELEAQPLNDQLILIKGSNGTRLFQLPALL
jgi:UDP-N-acetylmuramoyl-tripeptide--D-alanyl-D-alanine ligase